MNGLESQYASTLKFVMTHLEAALERRELPRVASESRVPYRTVRKIASRKTPRPTIENVQLLARYFERRAA